MNALLPQSTRRALRGATLDDKYALAHGRAFMSGVQALVRLPMLQRTRDLAAGLNTGGFISGYRGSPLGTYDQALWAAQAQLTTHHVVFQPGVNEELAATAVWGTQQLDLYPHSKKYDGVFGLWYGKGPGVDRCSDVFKHANMAGTARHGGVIAVAGDDHVSKSSTAAHQSDHIFKACGLPVFFPSSVQDILDMGLHAFAMSRFSGLWSAMKTIQEVVESSSSVSVEPDRVAIVLPEDFSMPPGGLHIRWPDPPLDQEARLMDHKWYAALAYVRANRLNHNVIASAHDRFGIIASGKAFNDTRQALADLGLSEARCRALGIRLHKVNVVWPLEATITRDFAQGLQEILVVEEKRQVIEYQLKEELYNWRADVRPNVLGKFDELEGPDGEDRTGGEWSMPKPSENWLLRAKADLSPAIIAKAIAKRLRRMGMAPPGSDVAAGMDARLAVIEAKERALIDATGPTGGTGERAPWFCSGCPHNTSTRVPEGSRAVAGIGCHYMVVWMDRSTSTFTQMGGEGVSWVGQAPFTTDTHVFANLGDGTYFHSGLLAIRQSIAAGVNITYKILYNDAVAMTGGQSVGERNGVGAGAGVGTNDAAARGPGQVPSEVSGHGPGLGLGHTSGHSVLQIMQSLLAEGVVKLATVTDEPAKYDGVALAGGVTVHHRDELDRLQREFREIKGCTALIYDQTCATEKRRRRKRGTLATPDQTVVINELVCEGCGDCSVQSNCLSVEPVETDFGRKRRINQNSCNKDYSCVKGFCPSFVTVEGGRLKTPQRIIRGDLSLLPPLPEPALRPVRHANSSETRDTLEAPAARVWGIVVGGVGGTGVITIGQLLGMAAHLEGKGVVTQDAGGLAQKGGATWSHIQIAPHADAILTTKVDTAQADLVIGCDAIVTAHKSTLALMQPGRTCVALNTHATPTAAFVHNADWQFPGARCEAAIEDACGGASQVGRLDAAQLATALLGDAIYTNPLLLGYAWQRGWVPLSRESIRRAMELNAVQIANNHAAFEWGRRAAHDLPAVQALTAARQVIHFAKQPSLDETLAQRSEFLTAYQNAAYAQAYRGFVERVRARESALADAAPAAATVSAGPAAPATSRPARQALPLTEAVARYLFKLMAYKDEYEVARLHSDPAFHARLAEQFEGKVRIGYHLAPPLLARRNDRGELQKQPFGAWVGTAFRLLARLKGLRGTPLDPFGRTAERRTERALIGEYRACIDELLCGLTADNQSRAAEIARLPDGIRGYGHVKERHLAETRVKWAALMAAWRAGRTPTAG